MTAAAAMRANVAHPRVVDSRRLVCSFMIARLAGDQPVDADTLHK